MENLKIDFFFLSPVQVVKVTQQNLEEVAEWCGGNVLETPSRRQQGRMDKYVLVPTPKDSKVSWAFPGMFVTKRLVITMKGEIKATWAVFRRDYFEKNYFDSVKAASDATWEREHDTALQPKEEVVVHVSVGEAMGDALEKIKKIAASAGSNVTINVNPEQAFVENDKGQFVPAFSHQDTPEVPAGELTVDQVEEIPNGEIRDEDIPAPELEDSKTS